MAGRDKGGFYLVVEVNDCYAKVVDGEKRLLSKPKNKNLKHLRPCGYSIEKGMEVPGENKLTDALVRNILRDWRQRKIVEEGEV